MKLPMSFTVMKYFSIVKLRNKKLSKQDADNNISSKCFYIFHKDLYEHLSLFIEMRVIYVALYPAGIFYLMSRNKIKCFIIN